MMGVVAWTYCAPRKRVQAPARGGACGACAGLCVAPYASPRFRPYTHPNGTRTEYDYDNWHRLAGIYHKDATTNDVLDSFAYTLTDSNAIQYIHHADNSFWYYTYDTRNRLATAARRAARGNRWRSLFSQKRDTIFRVCYNKTWLGD